MVISSPIFNMFGRSPIKPLQRHIDQAHRAATQLVPFIDAALAQNWDQAEKEQQLIAQYEKEADLIKKDLRLHLPKGLFLPVPRSDLLALLAAQDSIANRAEDIAGIILGRRMNFLTIQQNYKTFLLRCIDAAHQARKAINELDELLETGFRGNEVDLVEEMINKLDEIEHDTDDLQIALRYELFKSECELPPIDVIFLYKVIELTGDLADCAQGVGARLELLLAH